MKGLISPIGGRKGDLKPPFPRPSSLRRGRGLGHVDLDLGRFRLWNVQLDIRATVRAPGLEATRKPDEARDKHDHHDNQDRVEPAIATVRLNDSGFGGPIVVGHIDLHLKVPTSRRTLVHNSRRAHMTRNAARLKQTAK